MDLGGGEPARLLQLVADDRLDRRALGVETDHQRGRERPGLRSGVTGREHRHARLFHHLARDRLFERFTRLDETGQHRPAARRPAGLPAQQQPRPVADRHDHGRVGARVMLEAAGRAARAPAGAHQHELAAAAAAVAVAQLPVQQRTCLRHRRGLQRRPLHGQAAQVEAAGQRLVQGFVRQGEPSGVAGQAQETRGRRPGLAEARAGGELRGLGAAVEAGVAFGVDHQHAGRGPAGVEFVGAVAHQLGAVQARVAEGVAGRHRRHGGDQAEKLLPQPQVVLAFGLRITNCAPCRLSR